MLTLTAKGRRLLADPDSLWRSAVLASRTSCRSRSPKVPAGRPSRRSSRPMRPVTSWPVSRRPDAVTSASKIVKSVAEWVNSRHVRRSNHERFAYQSSGSGAGAGSAVPSGLCEDPPTAQRLQSRLPVAVRVRMRADGRRGLLTEIKVTERAEHAGRVQRSRLRGLPHLRARRRRPRHRSRPQSETPAAGLTQHAVADFAGRVIIPPDGADLVWSPTNAKASVL